MVAHDKNGLEVLDRAECLTLLSEARTGRVGVSVRALPVILPVNYALMGDAIVLRSVSGSKLDAALAGAVVAFEVDQLHEHTAGGWSVLVQGVATVLKEPTELARAETLGLRPWVNGRNDRYVKISTDVISGRRLSPSMVLAGDHPSRDAKHPAVGEPG